MRTIAVAALALRYVPFGFLVAPMAFSFWFLSMDVAALLARTNELSWSGREWVSVVVGLITMAIGFGLDRTLSRDKEWSEDFPFWCYLFGLMAFWGGLTAAFSFAVLALGLYAALRSPRKTGTKLVAPAAG